MQFKSMTTCFYTLTNLISWKMSKSFSIKMGEPKVSYFGPFPWCCEITILSTDPSPQVSVWSVHENVISPRCDQFKNNQLPHRGEASVRWGKIQRLLMTFSGEHAPKISNRFLIITILGIIIIIITLLSSPSLSSSSGSEPVFPFWPAFSFLLVYHLQ